MGNILEVYEEVLILMETVYGKPGGDGRLAEMEGQKTRRLEVSSSS
ncbi:MAG: hypothetical protein M3Z24_11120 [Chloroflexota bacterium]|nr:hypothetical protein [Chloroflexota bacterium]